MSADLSIPIPKAEILLRVSIKLSRSTNRFSNSSYFGKVSESTSSNKVRYSMDRVTTVRAISLTLVASVVIVGGGGVVVVVVIAFVVLTSVHVVPDVIPALAVDAVTPGDGC